MKPLFSRPNRYPMLLTLGLMLGLVALQGRADTLDDLIDMAYRNHPSIKAKKLGQQSAEKEILAAKLNFLPTVSVSAQPLHRNYGVNEDAKDPYTAITVKQSLLGGGLFSNLQMTKAKKGVADWTLEETRRDLAVKVINSFAQWYGAHKKLEAANESVLAHEKFTELITRRRDGGVSTDSEVNQSISRLEQAKAEQASYKAAEFSALVSLNQLTGKQISRDLLLQAALEEVKLPNDIIAQAIAVSPTLHRLEYVARVAEHQAGVTKAQAYPVVSLQAQRVFGSTSVSGAKPYTSVGLVAEYSSSNGFSTLVKGSAAEDQYRSALLDIDAARRDIVVQVNSDVSEYASARVRRQALANTAEKTKEVSESYDRLFRVGKKSWLELLNSVRERTQTLTSLADVESSVIATGRRLKLYTTLQGADEEVK